MAAASLNRHSGLRVFGKIRVQNSVADLVSNLVRMFRRNTLGCTIHRLIIRFYRHKNSFLSAPLEAKKGAAKTISLLVKQAGISTLLQKQVAGESSGQSLVALWILNY